MTDPRGCYYCGTDVDTRPYGPQGSRVCLPCVSDPTHPDRETAARAAFSALLGAAMAISPSGFVDIGGLDGPEPFDPRDLL